MNRTKAHTGVISVKSLIKIPLKSQQTQEIQTTNIRRRRNISTNFVQKKAEFHEKTTEEDEYIPYNTARKVSLLYFCNNRSKFGRNSLGKKRKSCWGIFMMKTERNFPA